MKHILLMIAMLAGTGCATNKYELRDSQSRPGHTQILDQKACTIHSGRYIDMEYYYACMQQKGYAFEVVGTVYK